MQVTITKQWSTETVVEVADDVTKAQMSEIADGKELVWSGPDWDGTYVTTWSEKDECEIDVYDWC